MNEKRIGMKSLLFLGLLFALPEFAFPAMINIGGQKINIPSPPGFSEISSISPETLGFFQDLCLPSLKLLAVFFSQEDVGKIVEGKLAKQEEYMILSCVRKIEAKVFSKKQFEELRHILRSQHENIYQENKDLIGTFMSSASKSFSKNLEEEIDLKLGGTAPLGIDSETHSSIAMSQISKYEVSQGGRVEKFVMAATTTTMLVNGKVFPSYTYRKYRGKRDLEWTRETSQRWMQSIFSANAFSKSSYLTDDSNHQDSIVGRAIGKGLGFAFVIILIFVGGAVYKVLRAKNRKKKNLP